MAYTAHSNSKYDRIKEIKKIKDGAYYAAITCESHGCPLFSRCSQFASMGKKTSRTPIKLFFVFDAPDQGDVNEGVAAVSDAGMYFRKNWLNPFIQLVGATSYLITHLVRTPIVDAKNSPRAALASEAAYCWEHFWRDMMEYKPKALIVFGPQVFQQLYQKAINKEVLPDAEAQNIIKLRKNSYKMQFTADYSVDVFVGYAPSYILRSLSSKPRFTEDMHRVVNYISPGKMDLSKQKIEIDKIDLIDTVDGALDFIDFLTRGLPQNEMFDLAFDTETDDLNRVFNNKFLSWQFSYKPGHAVFIPIEHPEKPIFADINLKLKLIAAFQNLLNSSPEQTRIAWILAHNAKFDLSVLYGLYRILPRGSIPIWDTLLAMHWLDENRKSAAAGTSAKPYSLKTLGKEFFSLKNEQGKWVEFEYKSEALAARADGDLVNLSFDALVEYGGTDTILTWHLKQEQMRQAREEQKGNALEKLDRFMRHYYSPASRAIAFMECNGLHVSKEQLQYLQGEESPIWNRIDRIEKIDLQTAPEILDFKDEYKNIILGTNISYEDDLWGNDNTSDSELVFNPNKKDQETPFYLNFLKLTPLALSKKTDKPTLNKEFLNHYASREEYLTLPSVAPYVSYYTTPLSYDEEGDPVFPKNPLQLILELRELSKLGNTYLKGIGDMIGDKKGDCIDGRVRASYWMSGTDTGRVSSSSPNLQNLPSGRTPMAKEVKNLFQAEPPSKKFPEGTVLLQLDYKTAEVRWAAIFANDQNLIRVFKEARESLIAACAPGSTMSNEEFEATQLESDIHRRTASLMFNVSPKEVSKSMRQASKGITFGLLFGMGTQTLAKNNGWTDNEAEEKIEMFYSAFPQLRDWLERNPKIAERDGYVETMMGRRRRLQDFYAAPNNFRAHAKASRLAKNAPIQGQSSDGGNIGLINFFQFLLDNNLEKKWLIQNVVHDSCLVQVPMADLEKALEAMQYHFVEGMADYIKKYFNFTLPLPIECEIEVGLKYGDLTKWDGRPSTLPGLREKLKEDAKKLWSKKEDTGKPPSDFDLIPWCCGK